MPGSPQRSKALLRMALEPRGPMGSPAWTGNRFRFREGPAHRPGNLFLPSCLARKGLGENMYISKSILFLRMT